MTDPKRMTAEEQRVAIKESDRPWELALKLAQALDAERAHSAKVEAEKEALQDEREPERLEVFRLRSLNARLIEALRPLAALGCERYVTKGHAEQADCDCRGCNAARVLREVTSTID